MSPPIDAHTHIFTPELAFTARRRYTPTYAATAQDLLGHMSRHGVAQAVLIQPSFLGTDNGYLLAALAATPERLRGVVVVSPDIDDDTLAAYDAAGVVGIRLNLIGETPAEFLTAAWRRLAYRVGRLGWHVEIQAEGRDLPAVLDALQSADAPLVVDHFGRPHAILGRSDPGFQHMLRSGRAGNVWVKLSAPYRCGGADVAPYVRALLDRLGPGRLLWGSDWPFTQFETRWRYSDSLAELRHWCDGGTREAIAETSRRLFRFAGVPAVEPAQARQARG